LIPSLWIYRLRKRLYLQNRCSQWPRIGIDM